MESGAIEERLNKFADAIDKTSKETDQTLKKATEQPGELLKKAVKAKDTVETKWNRRGSRQSNAWIASCQKTLALRTTLWHNSVRRM
ncbi:MAG: hypothetical protein WDN27_05855 [Candidatus Saccharibacteria bacterium]